LATTVEAATTPPLYVVNKNKHLGLENKFGNKNGGTGPPLHLVVFGESRFSSTIDEFRNKD